MEEPAVGRQAADGLADEVASAVARGFDAYQAAFQEITQRARDRFEARDWRGAVADAAERLDLYGLVIDGLEKEVRTALGPQTSDREVWAMIKTAFSQAVAERPDSELAKTFYNSVTRRIFTTVGVDRNIEFAGSDFDLPPTGTPRLPLHAVDDCHEPAELVRAIVTGFAFNCEFEDLERDVRLAGERITEQLRALGLPDRVDRAQVIPSPFFRRKGAYILGWIHSGDRRIPLALALLNEDRGIVVDAVLTDENDVSILFSFARSHFFVDLSPAAALIRHLRDLMPRKPLAELYIALGHHKHGKTELYRDLLRHMQTTDEQFVFAPGIHGMVMVVFMLPGFDVVFKVIKDRFPPIKPMTPKDVRNTYRMVFRSERAGRLVEAQEFEHLEFDRARFAPDLVEQMQRDAYETVTVTDDLVVLHHSYMERRVTPLDVYLKQADEPDATAAVVDYGQAIKDLAATGIFPGELLPKNFGVTRHQRVVCYDYDELSFLSDFTFRAMPEDQFDDDDMAEESWFGVGLRDVFPEEIRRFIGLPPASLEVLDRHHAELYQVEFWHEMQARVARGDIIDLYPYAPSHRLEGRAPQG